eukprot:TRINITY_DN45408_c0_g1_i1.p1 TRINITY_DN45408_c0_g1~~TRINITY_DN45408_c0_g1_i1.p1  ORF type:complete len:359 (-),score=40.68 TRINITY_DN45408_c0_g1_i1:534-1544(-)
MALEKPESPETPVAYTDPPALATPKSSLAGVVDTSDSPRFSYDDPAMITYLHERGYAVVAGAIDETGLVRSHELLWQFLGGAAEWSPTEPSTWTDMSFSRMGVPQFGLINGRGVGQSDLLWYVRTCPLVREAFQRIWETSELLTSFDGMGVFRPWHGGDFQKTTGGWFHVDQGRSKPGLQCVQGLVSLFDQNARTGGLVVIPASHLHHNEVVELAEDDADFININESSPLLRGQPRLVCCKAGDLVLWDSRTIHCNTPAVEVPTCPCDQLLRAVVYVCMTPKAWATPEALRRRREGYEIRMTTTHWPHTGALGVGWGKPCRLDFDKAEDERKALIC